MKYIKVRIVVGESNSLFDIYYDSVIPGNEALLYDTGLPAVGLSYTDLTTGEGITVSVPDGSTSIVVDSTPDAFCSETVNVPTYSVGLGCISYTVSTSMGIFNYFYTDCNCNSVSATIDGSNGYVEQTFCALQDSVNYGTLTIVNNGNCPPA